MLSKEHAETLGYKAIYTTVVVFIGMFVHACQRVQEIFAATGAGVVIHNVTTTDPDAGQQMILTLGMSFYKLIYLLPSAIVEIFIIGTCVLAIVLIWRDELFQVSEKLNKIRITFDKEKKDE